MKKVYPSLVMAILSFGFVIGQRKSSLNERAGHVVNQSLANSAPCQQPASRSCSMKGKLGQQICDGGVWTACGNAKYIMTIEGVGTHPIEMEIRSFSLGSEKKAGITKGAVHVSDLQVSKQHDVASQKLFRDALSQPGKLFRVNLKVEINDDEGHLLSSQQFGFSDASVSNYQESGAGPGPTETITFHFANMSMRLLREN